MEKFTEVIWKQVKDFSDAFLHPDLFGSYVFAASISALMGVVYAFGFGCVFRVGGFIPLIVIPVIVMGWAMVLVSGALQRWFWRRVTKTTVKTPPLRVSELIICSLFGTMLILFSGVWMGAEFRESKARKICRRADSLLAMLQEEKSRTGIYPANLRAYVKTNVSWRREVLFYYGETNGVDWQPHHVASSDITVMTFSNRLECMVPIERMSPVSFSSFQVFVFTSEHPSWFKSRLHWSLNGAYVDPPKD